MVLKLHLQSVYAIYLENVAEMVSSHLFGFCEFLDFSQRINTCSCFEMLYIIRDINFEIIGFVFIVKNRFEQTRFALFRPRFSPLLLTFVSVHSYHLLYNVVANHAYFSFQRKIAIQDEFSQKHFGIVLLAPSR